MPRRRKHDLGLPPRMYKRGPSYFFDQRPGWVKLGRDYHDALAAYAQLIARQGKRGTVGELLDEYWLRIAPKAGLAESTIDNYKGFDGMIRQVWGDDRLRDVRRGDAQRFLDTHPRQARAANAMRWFSMVLELAASWEWVDRNPVADLRYPKRVGRKRTLTANEWSRIYAQLLPMHKLMADAAFILSTRVSEVVDLRWDDVRDGVLYMRRRKNKDVHPFQMTAELQAVFDAAKALVQMRTLPVISPYVFPSERRRPFNRSYVSTAFNEAAVRAGVNRPGAHPDNVRFHDIRRTSANVDRKTATDRLGHASEQTTRTFYIDGKDPVLPVQKPRRSE